MLKIKALKKADGVYIFENNSFMQRESDTLTPNGCKMNGRWVYRDADKKMLGFDRYRNDLAERFSLDIYVEPN